MINLEAFLLNNRKNNPTMIVLMWIRLIRNYLTM
jgi:hypothetical protein